MYFYLFSDNIEEKIFDKYENIREDKVGPKL